MVGDDFDANRAEMTMEAFPATVYVEKPSREGRQGEAVIVRVEKQDRDSPSEVKTLAEYIKAALRAAGFDDANFFQRPLNLFEKPLNFEATLYTGKTVEGADFYVIARDAAQKWAQDKEYSFRATGFEDAPPAAAPAAPSDGPA